MPHCWTRSLLPRSRLRNDNELCRLRELHKNRRESLTMIFTGAYLITNKLANSGRSAKVHPLKLPATSNPSQICKSLKGKSMFAVLRRRKRPVANHFAASSNDNWGEQNAEFLILHHCCLSSIFWFRIAVKLSLHWNVSLGEWQGIPAQADFLHHRGEGCEIDRRNGIGPICKRPLPTDFKCHIVCFKNPAHQGGCCLDPPPTN